MIVSRVVPNLIRLNRLIKLSHVAKKEISNYSSRSLARLCPGSVSKLQFKNMSSDIDNELNDPKRHYDYKKLVERKDQQNVVVIDVREHSEINETGKIPGSIHIPLNDLQKALSDLTDDEFFNLYKSSKPKPSDEVIFTCRSGRRSLTAMKIAYESGYQNSKNFKGGWLDWAANSGQSK